MTIIGDVTYHLSKNAGSHCHVSEMANEYHYSEKQIRQAISNKKNEDKEWASHLRTVINGSMWMWIKNPLPPTTPSPEKVVAKNIYEQIGATKNGDLILQDEDGNLFRATELS